MITQLNREIEMTTLNDVRIELWDVGLRYGKACIELGLSKEAAIEKYITTTTDSIDKDTLIIAKCAIAFAYC